MIVISTELAEVALIEPRLFGDERGSFMESYNRARFAEAVGSDPEFVQDNQSRSVRGVLRGLHYQLPAAGQGKLVRAIAGEIYDVAVDIRRSSPNFGKWVGVYLSATNRRQLWIAEGFAHDFLTVSEIAEVAYKASGYYASHAAGSIVWDDPELAIAWPVQEALILSDKEAAAPRLRAAETFV